MFDRSVLSVILLHSTDLLGVVCILTASGLARPTGSSAWGTIAPAAASGKSASSQAVAMLIAVSTAL